MESDSDPAFPSLLSTVRGVLMLLGSGCDPASPSLLSTVPGMFGVAGSQQLSDPGRERARPSHSLWSFSCWPVSVFLAVKSLVCLASLVAVREAGTQDIRRYLKHLLFKVTPMTETQKETSRMNAQTSRLNVLPT